MVVAVTSIFLNLIPLIYNIIDISINPKNSHLMFKIFMHIIFTLQK
jgi:hypothetical protein